MDDTLAPTPTKVGMTTRLSLFRLPQTNNDTFVESPTTFENLCQNLEDSIGPLSRPKPSTRRSSARMSIGPGPRTSEPIETPREDRRLSLFNADMSNIPHYSTNRRSLFEEKEADEMVETLLEDQDSVVQLLPLENRRTTFGPEPIKLSRFSLGGKKGRRETIGSTGEIEYAKNTESPQFNLGETFIDTEVTSVGRRVSRKSVLYGQKGNMSQLEEQSSFMNNTALDAIMQLEENPLIKDTGRLRKVFHEIAADFQSSIIFNQLQHFERALEPHVQQLRSVLKDIPKQHHKYAELKETEVELSDELFTWRLVCSLYSDRFLVATQTESPEYTVEQLLLRKEYVSEKEIIDHLVQSDTQIRQAQLVIDWLELTALEGSNLLAEKNSELMICGSKGWEMTLVELERSRGKSTLDVVSELDMDAPLRQGRYLHSEDVEIFDSLNMAVFRKIRTGRLTQAKELLIAAGFPQLAVRLVGWYPFHDPNFDSEGHFEYSVERKPVEGNPRRSLWKKIAWSFCEQTKISPYERGSLAPFCGHLKSMLDVASDWMDILWSHLKVFVDQGIEKFVRKYETTTRFFAKVEDLPEGYLKTEWDLEAIFDSVEAFSSSKGMTDKMRPINVIQKCIILDDCDGLIEQAELWLDNDRREIDRNTLRFLCHLTIFLKRVHKLSSETSGAAIIEAYIKELKDCSEHGLIAWYTSELPEEQQILVYAAYLESLTTIPLEEKNGVLELGKRCGLDVKKIAVLVAHSTRKRQEEDLPCILTDVEEIPPLPVFKIFGHQWLLWDGVPLCGDAIFHNNALCREFLLVGDLENVAGTLDMLPDNIVDLVKQECIEAMSVDDNEEEGVLPSKEENAIREHICVRSYLQCQEAFENWLMVLNSKPCPPTKPKTLEGPMGSHHYAEQLAFEKKEHLYKKDLKKWESRLSAITDRIIRRLREEVIEFSGGWLIDLPTSDDKDEESERRERELDLIRKDCLPKACSLLYQVLLSSKRIEEIQQMEAIIMNPEYQVSKSFREDELEEFLEKIWRANRT
ncbi:nuclear pore complex protein Nup107-like [Artemia franciscana]|uniref:Nuclear pore complex protein n=1 Tax=Artemia franciscana TaxID=6661 RepID=A0AA88HIN1_ARTSF|nr:hypothetical protein QYM36_011432 [Artemia franciscana]